MTTNELIILLQKYPNRKIGIKDLNFRDVFEDTLDEGDFDIRLPEYFLLPALEHR